MRKLAIIGSGPTAIYLTKYLLQLDEPLDITIYEKQAEAGKGTPYHQSWNDKAMLSNIASIELPAVTQTLVEWLENCTDYKLDRMGVSREEITDRMFFPRVVLGEYFQAQLKSLLSMATGETQLTVKAQSEVIDVSVTEEGICLDIRVCENEIHHEMFDYAVMATGHVWPSETEIKPGYYSSPWPAASLSKIRDGQIGILGTSLSGIDAVVALAVARGSFERNAQGKLEYLSEPGTDRFAMTMMSRKGLLPEADFYCPIPYAPLTICTREAVDALIATGSHASLLDNVYRLFQLELRVCDPDYADRIDLESLSLENFCHGYFAEREKHDAFDWAASNLAEAKHNMEHEITVGWRYAILRMHEVVKYIVPLLTADDLKRFNTYFKPMFVDDYATVPHKSIERLIALHDAGKLNILRLGEDYKIDSDSVASGAVVITEKESLYFDTLIEAMGQRTLRMRDFPFPTLWKQGIVTTATASQSTYSKLGQRKKDEVNIGGIALDSEYHPVCDSPVSERLYCLSLPFMLSQFPFAQGITSSHDMGKEVAESLEKQFAAPEVPIFLTDDLHALPVVGRDA